MAIQISVENDEFERFQNELENRLVNNWEQVVKNSLLQCAELYLKDVIKATPVGTKYRPKTKGKKAHKPGNLKRQWRKDNKQLALKIKTAPDGYFIQLVNTTEYASWVEKGHESYNQFGGSYGWVMGQFFVKKTENIWQNGKLDKTMQRRINDWMRSLLGG